MWLDGIYIVDHLSLITKEKLNPETSKQMEQIGKDINALRKKLGIKMIINGKEY